jgi:hypothetical protein
MSPRTIYLSRLIGLLILVFGVSMLIDKPKAIAMVNALVQDRAALMIVAALGTAAGLAIVLGHQVWSGGVLPVVVTVLGWIFLARGVLLLFLSPPATAHLVEWFRFDRYFYLYLGFSLALGLYLTVHGFIASPAGRRG